MGKDAAQVRENYWLRWQVLVCAPIFLLPTLISLILINTRRRRPIQAQSHNCSSHHHLWVPCWRNLHPRWLLYYRALAFLTMTFLLYQTVRSFGLFFFYTQWTFALVVVYFALATIISAHGCWINSNAPFPQTGEKDRFLKPKLEEEINNDEYVSSTSMGKQDRDFIKVSEPIAH